MAVLPRGRHAAKVYGKALTGRKKNHNKTKGNRFEKYVLNQLLLSGIPAKRVRTSDILLIRTNQLVECKYLSSACRPNSSKSAQIQWLSLTSLLRADYTVFGFEFLDEIVVLPRAALEHEVTLNHTPFKKKVILPWPTIYALKPMKFSEFIRYLQVKHGVLPNAEAKGRISD